MTNKDKRLIYAGMFILIIVLIFIGYELVQINNSLRFIGETLFRS